MPNYLYYCNTCEVEFEELLIQSDEIKQYRDGGFPCPVCHSSSERIKVNTISFNFKGGTPGNSGSHDVDYPSLDKCIGRSADKKWQNINQRKEARDKIRKEAGTNAISQTPDGKDVPADPNVLKTREKAIKLYKKALKNT